MLEVYFNVGYLQRRRMYDDTTGDATRRFNNDELQQLTARRFLATQLQER